ncbi:MAG TPA: hypothetical protein ENN29_01325 [Candidatus Hydrogenedentes bacterium]|nr:hypothetical protein [Candidatus Hydrogenedentota bacterium]
MFTHRNIKSGCILLTLLLCAGTAGAWGPRTQLAIVNTALNLMSREQNVPLTRLQKDIRAGASIDDEALQELYPDLVMDPLRAIENELALLTAARRPKLDAYYAFRLGTLGKVTASVTAPMSKADAVSREKYYDDADQAVDLGALAPAPRRVFDTMKHFERIIREANASNDLITSEYQSGIGFRGAATSRLATDVSRSVNAVADIWWTIITSRAVAGNISEEQLRRYVLKGYAYRIERGNLAEIEAAEEYYAGLVSFTPDMRARIGDMLYDAGFRERAVREYEMTLAAAPERRDVVGKISEYYMEVAEEALAKEQLEEALAGFEKALAANALHPTAEQRRLETQAMIVKRDAQQTEYQTLLEQADELRNLAEQEAGRARYAEAVALLQQSEAAYTSVGDEFPAEAQRRARGLRETQYRIMELKQMLLNNTQAFSGAGFAADTARLVEESSRGIEDEALAAILERAYQAEIEELLRRMQPLLIIE